MLPREEKGCQEKGEKVRNRKGCQVPFPGRPGLRSVFSHPNCATAWATHRSELYGRLPFMAEESTGLPTSTRQTLPMTESYRFFPGKETVPDTLSPPFPSRRQFEPRM